MNQRPNAPYDLLGVGIGPFNLSLAALCDQAPDLNTLFCEARPEFRWHPGLLIDGTRMQVPFLADLVSLVDPTNPWSFLNYLRHQQRLFPFYFSERFHLPRRAYEHYCRWAAERLTNCRFGTPVTSVHWDTAEQLFRVTANGRELSARNVVLGVGTEPYRPSAFAALADHPRVWHCAQYLDRRSTLGGVRDITVLGSGQSGAEVFLDLLRTRAGDGTRLRWLTRTRAFAPMEYSKLGLEHFTPDYPVDQVGDGVEDCGADRAVAGGTTASVRIVLSAPESVWRQRSSTVPTGSAVAAATAVPGMISTGSASVGRPTVAW